VKAHQSAVVGRTLPWYSRIMATKANGIDQRRAPRSLSVTRLDRLFNAYSLIGASIFAGFSALMFARGRQDIAIGCAVGLVLTVVNLLIWLSTRRTGPASLMLLVVGGLGILWVLSCDPGRCSPFFWVPFFSMVPFFLLGHRRGLIAAFVFAVPVGALAIHTQAILAADGRDPVFLVRFSLALVGTVLFAFLFEQSRHRTHLDYERELAERQRVACLLESTNQELSASLEKVKILSGLLPICANCKKIRDEHGYWYQIESYITEHSEAHFSHGLCEVCVAKLYGDR